MNSNSKIQTTKREHIDKKYKNKKLNKEKK